MEIKLNEKYDFYGSAEAINPSTYPTYSVIISLPENESAVVRLNQDQVIEKGEIYHFQGQAVDFKGRLHILLSDYKNLREEEISEEEKNLIRTSLNKDLVIDYKLCENYIEEAMASIENKVVKEITKTMYDSSKEDFLIYPAATKFHHAYKYGLLFHTYNMLRLSKAYTSIYPHLNKDLIVAGIVLHDLMKTKEIKAYTGEYTIEGKLLGHISMVTSEVAKTAEKLGYSHEEETLLLEHIVLSHHEQSFYGSPKRPQIIEALIVHLCDMADAKVEPTIEALLKTQAGEFSEPIPVNDKEKYLKHSLSK
ncbi:MAG: HD domain-containing protein [Bacillales bacterium]|nr:HD domain-containing protein [Bacillales bacterium]